MKRILALCLITFTMALVVNTVSIEDKYSLDEAYQMENCDVIAINDVDFTIAKTVFTPNYIVEVGIVPPYSCEGVYYSEFSKDNSISNDDTYALNYDDPSKGTNELYGTNYFLHSIRQNNNLTSTNYTKSITNDNCYSLCNLYKEVGITAGVIQGHCNDATT